MFDGPDLVFSRVNTDGLKASRTLLSNRRLCSRVITDNYEVPVLRLGKTNPVVRQGDCATVARKTGGGGEQ
jgi:hypothetical protein